jgi:hypothetical protein
VSDLMGAVGIQRVRGEDGHADQAEDARGDLDHCLTSRLTIAARNLLRDWLQRNSKMACMVASLFDGQRGTQRFVSGHPSMPVSNAAMVRLDQKRGRSARDVVPVATLK